MSAYGTIDASVAGMKQGLSSRVESKISGDDAGIAFGKPVFKYVGNDNQVFTYKKNKVTFTLASAMQGVETITLTIDGTATEAVQFDTSMPVTAPLIIAALEAAFPTAIVACTDVGTTALIYTVEIQDDDNRVGSGVITGTAPAVTPTYSSTMVFKGFAMFTQKEAAVKKDLSGTTLVAATAAYQLGDSVNVMVDGWISTLTDSAVDSGMAVYAVDASGATQGLVTDTVGSNVALANCKFETTLSGAGLAIVRINQ